MHQISGSPGLRSGPHWGTYSALPNPLAGFRGEGPGKGTGKGVEKGKGRGGRGEGEGGLAPWVQGGGTDAPVQYSIFVSMNATALVRQ